MVKITRQYLIKHSENLRLIPVRHKNETDTDFLRRITHLKLQRKFIDDIDDLKDCKNVTYLYLQNNILQSICDFHSFTKLTHLYLQRNKISKIENLDSLVNIKKLYLGYNEITVVEGLENLKALKELHLEFQSVPLGETIYFDPRTVKSLSACLELLNVGGNGLLTLLPLMNMAHLTELMASENNLCDLQDLVNALLTWPSLERISLAGNPFVSKREFKDTVILHGHNLKYLDGAEIRTITRRFIEAWKKDRRAGERGKGSAGAKGCSPKAVHFTHIAKTGDDLPINYSKTNCPLTYQPWKIRSNVNCFGATSPRPFRMKPSQE